MGPIIRYPNVRYPLRHLTGPGTLHLVPSVPGTQGPVKRFCSEKTIYVIGGRGADCQGTIEVWNSSDDPNTDCWRIIPDLNVKHQNQEYVVTLLESEC